MTGRSKATERGTPKRRGAPVVGRVLEVALEELAQVGYHGLSLPEVAERAGLNKTSVYRRWPTKGALVAAALEQAMGHDAPLPDTGSLRSDALAFALAAAAWAESPVGRGVMKVLLTEGDDDEVRGLVGLIMRSRGAGPTQLFDRAIARGELDASADVEMALTLIAGAMSHRILMEKAPVTPAFVTRLVALIMDGLTATSG